MDENIILNGKTRDLGGFSVIRSLPQAKRRQVGPFVFLDHMGPLRLTDTAKLDVRPHPHIGLSTVTYLFEGRGLHRDSLGFKQVISPGDLNWMTAGRGIVHSERTPEEDLLDNKNLHGVQIWVALPKEFEDCEPSFTHYSKDSLPKFKVNDSFDATLMIGNFENKSSVVKTHSQMIFMELISYKAGSSKISFAEEEIAIFLIEGDAQINNQKLEIDDLIIVTDPKNIWLTVSDKTRLIVIGGKALPEPRYMWWNFVSSDKEKIRQAAKKWSHQEMGKVMEEDDYIPLPNDPLP